MALRDDFLELSLYLEDYEDDDAGVSLWVHGRDRSMLVFHNVRHNPVRYQGWWSIDHEFLFQRATASIPSDEVWYFTVVSPRDNRPAEPDDIYGVESTLLNGDTEDERLDLTVPDDADLAVAEAAAAALREVPDE